VDDLDRNEPRVLHAVEQALAGPEQGRDDIEHKFVDGAG